MTEEISSIQQSYICVGLEIPARGPLPIRHSDLVLIIKTALLQITKNWPDICSPELWLFKIKQWRGQLRWLAPILSHLPNFASYHWLWRSGVFKPLVVEEGGKLRGEIELINSAICPQVSALTSICRDLGSTSTIYFPQSLSSSLVMIMRAWDTGVRNWCLKWLLKLHRYFLGLSCIDIIEMILSDSCT